MISMAEVSMHGIMLRGNDANQLLPHRALPTVILWTLHEGGTAHVSMQLF
jgi:hypothetical protein